MCPLHFLFYLKNSNEMLAAFKSAVKFPVATARPEFSSYTCDKIYPLRDNLLTVFHYRLDAVSAHAGVHQDVQ